MRYHQVPPSGNSYLLEPEGCTSRCTGDGTAVNVAAHVTVLQSTPYNITIRHHACDRTAIRWLHTWPIVTMHVTVLQ